MKQAKAKVVAMEVKIKGTRTWNWLKWVLGATCTEDLKTIVKIDGCD